MDYTVENLPSDLEIEIYRPLVSDPFNYSETQVIVRLNGTALNHHPDDSIDNFTIKFHDSALSDDADLITNSTKDNLTITFIDTPELTYQIDTPADNAQNVANNTEFVLRFDESIADVEGVQNKGIAIYKSATDQLSNHISSRNAVKNINDKTFSFTYDHFRLWPRTSYYVTLDAGTFTDGFAYSPGITDKNTWNFTTQPASLSYSSEGLTEREDDDGRFDEVITVTLTGEAFTDELWDGDGLHFFDDYFTASNVPAGLNLEITKVDDTHLEIGLGRTADSHLPADSIDNFSITFTDDLFAAGEADLVAGSSINDLSITFIVGDYEVDWCRLQYPEACEIIIGESIEAYARVYIEGITDRNIWNDPYSLLKAQIGYGPDDTVPLMMPVGHGSMPNQMKNGLVQVRCLQPNLTMMNTMQP